MKRYDYSTEADDLDIAAELDIMTVKERKAAAQAIRRIRQNGCAVRIDRSRSWFNAALLPVLRDFAEMTASVLEISSDDASIVTAILKNRAGWDITESCRMMRMAFNLADYIRINAEGDTMVLTLVFDCEKYVAS